jgi:hypothetical protein
MTTVFRAFILGMKRFVLLAAPLQLGGEIQADLNQFMVERQGR